MTKNLTPHILAIETSTSACSVALGLGDDLIFKRSQVGNNIHSQVLLTMVQEVLEEASFSVNGLNAVAVGQGPGSFTGLRIGVGVAQGIAYGVGCPMIGVSSLMALAFQSREEGLVIAALDARMGEVYWGCYNNECNRADSKDERSRLYGDMLVSKPETMTRQRLVELLGAEFINKPFFLVGNAWSEYQDKFDSELLLQGVLLEECIYPKACDVLKLARQDYILGNTVLPIDFLPQYVRNDVAKKKV